MTNHKYKVIHKGHCEVKDLDKKSEYVKRHKFLHNALDELCADFIMNTNKLPSSTSIFELMEWSNEQTKNSTEKI